MASMKFKAKVCGWTPRDDGRYSVMVQEQDPGDEVKFYVHDLAKNFDPKSANRSFRARNQACPYTPGLGYYSFAVDAGRIQRYPLGSVVDVELAVSVIHNVNFSDKNGRWFTSNDLRYELVKLGSSSDKSSAQTYEEAAQGASGGKGGK